MISLNLAVMLLLATGAALYARAVRILRRRGYRVSTRQQAAGYGGLALMAFALLGPVGVYVDRLMVAHMAEHLLIADLAAPLLLVGVRTPVHLFLMPRVVLVAFARRPWLRRAMRVLRWPPVAIVVFLFVLYGWHLRPAFEATLRSDLIHALQHQSFIAASLLVWWSALEPERRRMPGGLWKIGHLFAARLVSGMLGMVFVFSRAPYYPNAYGNTAERYGLSALDDQQLAGGLMMSLDFVVLVFSLSLFFWRSAEDEDRAQAAAPHAPTPGDARAL